MIPTIIQGDCLAGLKDMDDNLFDLALIDPPYFDYKTGHRKDKTGKLSQSLVQQSREDQLEVVAECIKKLKDDRAFYFFTNWQEAWWFQQRFHSYLRNEIIWDKGNWASGDLTGSFGCRYEVIFLGYKGSNWTYKGQRLHDIWGNLTLPDSGYNLNRVGTNRVHPTEKPVDLYRMVIDISTDPGALVFDPYVGSGSSAEAAMLTGRAFLGYELDKEFHRVATERVKRVTL